MGQDTFGKALDLLDEGAAGERRSHAAAVWKRQAVPLNLARQRRLQRQQTDICELLRQTKADLSRATHA